MNTLNTYTLSAKVLCLSTQMVNNTQGKSICSLNNTKCLDILHTLTYTTEFITYSLKCITEAIYFLY